MWTTLVVGVRASFLSFGSSRKEASDCPLEDLNDQELYQNSEPLSVSNSTNKTVSRHCTLQQPAQLQPDLWRHVLTHLPLADLCSVALVNRELHDWATEDRLWKDHCFQLCEGKQGAKHLLSLQQSNDAATQNKKHILSWKQKYLLAAWDSKRQRITSEEMSYYSWKLLYKRNGSNLGLRKFLPDGTYNSPYFGRCEWTLSKDGCLQVMGHSLAVERDPKTWGWIIGRGSSTVYHSVDVETWNWVIAKGNSTVHYKADVVQQEPTTT